MSVLGVVVRARPEHLDAVQQRLARVPGVDLGPGAGDGRLAATIESTAQTPAAAIMGEIAQWPEVLNLSLVFEHSDPDSDSDSGSPGADFDFRAWRGPVGGFAPRQPGQQAPLAPLSMSSSATPGAGEAR